MKKQKEFVINYLREHGEISRNVCLSNYITRLSAIIFVLKEEGWEFDPHWQSYIKADGGLGKDFVYLVKKAPLF